MPEADGPPVPLPEGAGTEAIGEALVALRSWAGQPSFGRIARRIESKRLERGVPAMEAAIARSTVYDCFRPNRRRLDVELVMSIVTALGVADADRARWREALLGALVLPSAGLAVSSVVTAPPPLGHWVGREDELARLLDASGSALVTGMAGSGKTALAWEAVRRIAANGAHQVVGINLAGFTQACAPVSARSALDALLAAMSDGSVPSGDPWRAWHRLLAAHPVLVVFDDAATAEQVEGLLPPPGSPSRALVTSRVDLSRSLPVPGLQLAELDDTAAVELLATATDDYVKPGAEALALVRSVGKLPLGLVLLADRLRAESGWALSDHVDFYHRRAEHLQLDDGLHGSITLSYERLDESDRCALRRVAASPLPDHSTALLAALWDEPEGRAAARAEHLVSVSLARRAGTGRYDLHDLVRLFSARQSLDVDPPSVLEAAVEAMLRCLLDDAAAAAASSHPRFVADWYWLDTRPARVAPAEALAWLRSEQAGIVRAVAWSLEHAHLTLAVRLAAVITPLLFDSADGRTLLALHEAVFAALDDPNPREAALARRNLGVAQRRSGDLEAAQESLSVALEEAMRAGDLPGALHARNHLATVVSGRGDLAAAAELLESNVAAYRGREGDEGLAQALMNLGVIRTRLGEPERAIELIDSSTRLAARLGWAVGEQMGLNNITTLLQEFGRLDAAQQAVERSLALARELGRPLGAAYATCTLASVRFDLGDADGALRLNAQARRMAEELGADDLVLMSYNNAGDYHLRSGDLAGAGREYAAARVLARSREDAFELARAEEGLRAARE